MSDLCSSGEAFIERKTYSKAKNLICILGEKGKVLLAVFSDQWGRVAAGEVSYQARRGVLAKRFFGKDAFSLRSCLQKRNDRVASDRPPLTAFHSTGGVRRMPV